MAERVCKVGVNDLAVLEGNCISLALKILLGHHSWGREKDGAIRGKLLLGAGFAIYTPRPMAPMTAIVTISRPVALIHCPKVGREFQALVPL